MLKCLHSKTLNKGRFYFTLRENTSLGITGGVITREERHLRWMLHLGAISGIGWDWDGSPGGVKYRAPSVLIKAVQN